MNDEIQLSVDTFIESLPSKHSRRGFKLEWSKYTSWLSTAKLTVVTARPKHVMAYLNSLKNENKAKATIQRARNIIMNIYGVLVRDELLSVNPARETKIARMSADPRAPVLTEEQVSAMLNVRAETWFEQRDRLCVALLFGLGWRRSEIARLRVEDFHGGAVHGIIKGAKKHAAGVPSWVLEMVIDWCLFADIKSGALLPRRPNDPRPISGDIVYAIVHVVGNRAGVPKEVTTPHALRRSNITLGGARGVSLRQRQLAVGHANQATTERYDRARDATQNAPGQVFANLIKNELDVFEAALQGGRTQSSAIALDALNAARHLNCIRIQRTDLPPASIDSKILSQFSGKTNEHQALCSSAAFWLEQQGKQWWSDAHHCRSAGGIADVVAQDLSIFVEAGHTTADKIITCLRAGQTILLVPYYFSTPVGFIISGNVPFTDAEKALKTAEKKAVEDL